MKVAEYVADFVSGISPRVYGVCGAGAMHLNDAIYNHPDITVIAMQHEQAAAMAAEAEARVTGKMSVVSVTTGPGGTNAMTGVACAYVDSIPMLVIAGQVTTSTMVNHSGLRQVGMNELNVVDMMRPITKYAVTVKKPEDIRHILMKACDEANNGRKGPVFVEIPLDVQAAEVDVEAPVEYRTPFDITDNKNSAYIQMAVEQTQAALRKAERPVVIIGNGVRLAGACNEFMRTFGHAVIPIVSSWGAADIVPTDHPYYIGRGGIFGDRASNFAVQGADLIIAIGTRLSIAQTGHAPDLFAPNAFKILIDIDANEIWKRPVDGDMGFALDARQFLSAFSMPDKGYGPWMAHCKKMKIKYRSGTIPSGDRINSYQFIDALAPHLFDDAIVVTDVGFAFIPTFQTLRLKHEQRLIHSAGVSPMGWGLPAAIGASLATDKKRQVVCLTGDGGLMLNLQELQTAYYHSLPILIFVYENQGYATMKIAQNNHFKREVMAGGETGLGLPDFVKVAHSFGIFTEQYASINDVTDSLYDLIMQAQNGPVVAVLHMENERIAPRLQARMENGKFVPVDIADMWPHLPREEIEANLKCGEDDVVKRFDGRRQEVLGAD